MQRSGEQRPEDQRPDSNSNRDESPPSGPRANRSVFEEFYDDVWFSFLPRTQLGLELLGPPNGLFYSALELLGPAPLWEFLVALRAAEIETGGGLERRVDFMTDLCRRHKVHGVGPISQFARRYVEAEAYLDLEGTFFAGNVLVGRETGRTTVDNADELNAVTSAGGRALVLPIHCGPVFEFLTALSAQCAAPVATVSWDQLFSTASFEAGDTAQKERPDQGIWAGDPRSLLKASSALKSGHVLVLSPDFTGGVGSLRHSVRFFGCQLLVPTAWATLASRYDTEIFLLLGLPSASGHWSAGLERVSTRDLTPQAIMSAVETRLRDADAAAHWWFWCHLDALTSGGST